jgi:hypothetical protein
MSSLLGKEAYKAAREQTKQKLGTMKEAMFTVAKEHSNSESTHTVRKTASKSKKSKSS